MKFFTVIISFLIGIIIFMPKENIFFTLQKELKKENIFINTKTSSTILNLYLKDSIIFINGIDIAKINSISITPLIFFNKIELKNIKIDFNNLKITTLSLNHSIIEPLNIKIKGFSEFANIRGNIDRKIKIYLLNLTNETIKSFLKKDKKGYFYAQKF